MARARGGDAPFIAGRRRFLWLPVDKLNGGGLLAEQGRRGWLAGLAEVGDAAGDEDGLVTGLAGASGWLGRCCPWQAAVAACGGGDGLQRCRGSSREGRR